MCRLAADDWGCSQLTVAAGAADAVTVILGTVADAARRAASVSRAAVSSSAQTSAATSAPGRAVLRAAAFNNVANIRLRSAGARGLRLGGDPALSIDCAPASASEIIRSMQPSKAGCLKFMRSKAWATDATCETLKASKFAPTALLNCFRNMTSWSPSLAAAFAKTTTSKGRSWARSSCAFLVSSRRNFGGAGTREDRETPCACKRVLVKCSKAPNGKFSARREKFSATRSSNAKSGSPPPASSCARARAKCASSRCLMSPRRRSARSCSSLHSMPPCGSGPPRR
mmetsp:Transcript_23163/g.65365  ORF Transcript_23163/g.65365 Transcript_23163/m.65365 type:complete len:285 (-) Transcript_23163:625-1479(-)